MSARRGRVHAAEADSVAAILGPKLGFRERLALQGVQPKNHHADNLRQLREQQEANRRAREEASRPPPPLFKLPEFDAVEAKILKDEKDASDAPRHEFLRRSDKTAQSLPPAPEPSTRRRHTPVRPPVPRLAETSAAQQEQQSSQPAKNFVRENKSAAAAARSVRRPPSGERAPRTERLGEVPEYLVKRKAELAEEAQRLRDEEERRKLPQGVVRMSEEDRQKTLAALSAKRDALTAELQRLPLVVVTESQRRRKKEVEERLDELDKALEVFQRPEVWVRV